MISCRSRSERLLPFPKEVALHGSVWPPAPSLQTSPFLVQFHHLSRYALAPLDHFQPFINNIFNPCSIVFADDQLGSKVMYLDGFDFIYHHLTSLFQAVISFQQGEKPT